MMRTVKIGKVCKISNGFAFKSDKYVSSEGARVIRITNVQKSKIVDNDPKIYPFPELTKLDNYKIYENDILMSLTGNVGRVGKFPKELLPAYINQRVCRIMPKSDDLDANFLFHYLNSDKFENEAIRNSSGAAQLNLSTNWLADHDIPLPPLETQKRIAQILDDAAALRNKTEQLLKEYDALAQAIFLDMFGDTWLNSKRFELKELQDVVKKDKIITYGIVQAGENVIEGVPYIRTGDIKNGKILEEQLYKTSFEIASSYERSKCSTGDIIMSIRATVGTIAILQSSLNGANLTQGTARISPDERIVNTTYLYHCILSKGIQFKIERYTKGATFKEITLGRLRKIEIPTPPIELQNQFAAKITLIEQQKELAKQELKESEDLFNCLLQKAFKGELV